MSEIYTALAGPSARRYFLGAERDPEECWPWPGPRDRDGYGLVSVLNPKRTRGAHRIALVIALGLDLDALAGQVVMHACDNPPCVNPAHLRLGTQADNVRDMHEKGRANCSRTYCLRGHALTPDNVYVHQTTGKRRCATCHRARQAAYDRRRHAS